MDQALIGKDNKQNAESEDKTYSGRLSVRIPKELHKELIKAAAENNVSLNQFILYKLSR